MAHAKTYCTQEPNRPNLIVDVIAAQAHDHPNLIFGATILASTQLSVCLYLPERGLLSPTLRFGDISSQAIKNKPAQAYKRPKIG